MTIVVRPLAAKAICRSPPCAGELPRIRFLKHRGYHASGEIKNQLRFEVCALSICPESPEHKQTLVSDTIVDMLETPLTEERGAPPPLSASKDPDE